MIAQPQRWRQEESPRTLGSGAARDRRSLGQSGGTPPDDLAAVLALRRERRSCSSQRSCAGCDSLHFGSAEDTARCGPCVGHRETESPEQSGVARRRRRRECGPFQSHPVLPANQATRAGMKGAGRSTHPGLAAVLTAHGSLRSPFAFRGLPSVALAFVAVLASPGMGRAAGPFHSDYCRSVPDRPHDRVRSDR